ncbi:MAG: T9SS type A sorting domain-containing protein [Muribaculaceae bacterium]
MKKLLLLAILAIFTANLAQSQTLTETNKLNQDIDFDDFVPDKFAFNNKGSLYIRNYDEDSRIETISFYNSDIQETAHFDIKSDKLMWYSIHRERQQDADGNYTGEWVETKENSYDDFRRIAYYDVSSNSGDYFSLYFSQTLFNNDEKYEYIAPVYGEFETAEYSYERDRDGDGEIDLTHEEYYAKRIGFDVVNQDGNVLCSIRPTIPEGYELDEYPYLLIIGGKRYLVTGTWGYGYRVFEYTFYLIDPTNTSLQQVGQPLQASVFPTMPRHNDVINVELEGNDKPGEIVVTNTKGQTVYKQKVAAGERRVQINSRRLSNGLNIITVNNGDEKQNFKVIVK